MMENAVENPEVTTEKPAEAVPSELREPISEEEYVEVWVDGKDSFFAQLIDKDKGLCQVHCAVDWGPYLWPGDLITATQDGDPALDKWKLNDIVTRRFSRVSLVRFSNQIQLNRLLRFLVLEGTGLRLMHGHDDRPDLLAVGHHDNFCPVVLAEALSIEQEAFGDFRSDAEE
jgi:hypothetical protein